MSTEKRSIVRNRDNGGAPSDTRFGEVTKAQSNVGATDRLVAADGYDHVVPTGEAFVGREAVVAHLNSGDARYGERVNLDRGKNKISGELIWNDDESVCVVDDDANRWDVLSYEYNNLTPNNLKGFRYQRTEDEAAEENSNPAYPNGRCRTCGFGLNDDGDCTNQDCSNSIEYNDELEADHAAYLDFLSGVNMRSDAETST